MMLNILEGLPLEAHGHNSASALHALIEAKKLSYADLSRYVGDPLFSAAPIDDMLSKAYAAERAKRIDPSRASDDCPHGTLPVKAGDTTYLSVVDRHGNTVSLIQSNFATFGSGLVPEGTGFALQNRGGLFTLDPDHPNVVARAKAATAYDHSWLHESRRRADCLRNHGRLEPGPGPRAVRLERGRPRHEHPGGPRGGALHETHVRRARRIDGARGT